MLQLCPTITELNLLNNWLGVEGAQHVAALLRKHTSLKCLDVGACGLGAEGATLIADAIADAPHGLESLSMYYNSIEDSGAIALANAIAHHEHVALTSLDISDNRIGNEGVLALLDAVQLSETLIALNVGHSGDLALSKALSVAVYENSQSAEIARMSLPAEPSEADLLVARAKAALQLQPPEMCTKGRKGKAKGKGKRKGTSKGKESRRGRQ